VIQKNKGSVTEAHGPQEEVMKVRTNVKTVAVKTGVRAGLAINRCEAVAVKTGVRAGLIGANRCETLR